MTIRLVRVFLSQEFKGRKPLLVAKNYLHCSTTSLLQQQTTKKKSKQSLISQACLSDPHLQPQIWGLDLSWSDVGEGGGEEDSADHPDERGGQTKHPVHGRPILKIEIELILNWSEID